MGSFSYHPALRRLEGLRRLCEARLQEINKEIVVPAAAEPQLQRIAHEMDGVRFDAQYQLECARNELGMSEGTEDDRLAAPLPRGVIETAEGEHERLADVYGQLNTELKALTSEDHDQALQDEDADQLAG